MSRDFGELTNSCSWKSRSVLYKRNGMAYGRSMNVHNLIWGTSMNKAKYLIFVSSL